MSMQLHATKKSKELSSADSGRIEIFLYARQLNDPRWCIVGRLLCHADVKSWRLNVFYRQHSYTIHDENYAFINQFHHLIQLVDFNQYKLSFRREF